MSRRAWWKRVAQLEEAMAPLVSADPWTEIIPLLSEDGIQALIALCGEFKNPDGSAIPFPEDRLIQLLWKGTVWVEPFAHAMRLLGIEPGKWKHLCSSNQLARIGLWVAPEQGATV